MRYQTTQINRLLLIILFVYFTFRFKKSETTNAAVFSQVHIKKIGKRCRPPLIDELKEARALEKGYQRLAKKQNQTKNIKLKFTRTFN
jgi:hypothetical protein